MSKRIQKMELQADLKKLQSFRSSMEALKSSMEAKALEVTDEQEAAGYRHSMQDFMPNHCYWLKLFLS